MKTAEEVFKRIRENAKNPPKRKYFSIEATEFVKGQISKKLLKMLPRIVKDTDAILNLYPEDCPQGLYSFSRIVPLHNEPYNKLTCRIVKITKQNEKYLKSDYVSRTEDEIPYLKRWFPKNAPVKGIKADHVDVILYNKKQLEKEGNPIKSDWGIVCINIESKERTPIAPTTMINNHLGIKFGGNGVKLHSVEYWKSVEFWKKHALQDC